MAAAEKNYCQIKKELFVTWYDCEKCTKIVIPTSGRQEMLGKIHDELMGIEKCQARAHETIDQIIKPDWPRYNEDIKNFM